MSILDGELEFHLKIKPGDIGYYVILPGDPARAGKIAELLDDPAHVSQNREYNIYTGRLDGVKVSVCSTGIGGPSAAIAAEELIHCGAHTLIRIGTCGGMDQKVRGGDLVIATAAVRSEGTSYEYIPPGYPAAADFTVVSALKKAAESLSQNQGGKQYHVGVIQSKDSFYGETDPNSMPVGQRLSENWSAYLKCGCLASEMEAAAIFSVAAVRKARAGCVLTAIWNVERSNAGLDDSVCMSNERAIKCAVYAIKELIKKDGR